MKKTRQGQAAVEHSTLERGTSKTVVSVICKADLIWSFRVIFFADTYEAVFRVAATQTGAILPPNPNLNSFQYFHFGSWGQNWSQGCRPTFLGTPLKPQLESKSKPPQEKAIQPSKTGAIPPPNPSLDSSKCFHFGSWDQRWISGWDQSYRPTM